jgi:predicted DNA-binding antitoxin AbrB/MazE fold protein
MSQEFDAIYENGVLRPLTPLALKDQQLVHVSLEERAPAVEERSAYEALLKSGYLGCLQDTPQDLSTNPKYMEGFGSDA